MDITKIKALQTLTIVLQQMIPLVLLSIIMTVLACQGNEHESPLYKDSPLELPPIIESKESPLLDNKFGKQMNINTSEGKAHKRNNRVDPSKTNLHIQGFSLNGAESGIIEEDYDEATEDNTIEAEIENDIYEVTSDTIDLENDSPFPPANQEPFFEKGVILPPNSLECVPVNTGVPQVNCCHHASTIAEMADGTVAAAWFHGVEEESLDTRIVWSKLAPGEEEWTWPEVLFDDPNQAESNPALWVAGDGTLFVFFVTFFDAWWGAISNVRLIRSTDNGVTWSEPFTLSDQPCWMTRHRPLQLENGNRLLPLYNECLAKPVFIRSTDNFETWTLERHISLIYFLRHLGQIQPSLILQGDGTIAAITRDGTATNRIKRMTSRDNGHKWTSSRSLALPNSGTSVDQVRLLNGHVVIVFNNSPVDRFPLTAALSYDEGQTFMAIRNLNVECSNENCSYSYPSIMQSKQDGTIWVTYTYNRQTIGWIHFNEKWLSEGQEEPNL